jgi:type II restriction/modification system DNA methylase subunit YeeA
MSKNEKPYRFLKPLGFTLRKKSHRLKDFHRLILEILLIGGLNFSLQTLLKTETETKIKPFFPLNSRQKF